MPQLGDVKTDRFTGKLVTIKEQLGDDYVRVIAVDGSNIGIGTRHINDLA